MNAQTRRYVYVGPGPGQGHLHVVLPQAGEGIVTWSLPPDAEQVPNWNPPLVSRDRKCDTAGYSWMGSAEDFRRHFRPAA
jgi:hypothetical protein